MRADILAALLGEAKRVDAWSRHLALVAGLVIGASVLGNPSSDASLRLCAGSSLALGILQAWFASRSSFDAAIFAKAAQAGSPPEFWQEFDQSMNDLKLSNRPVVLERSTMERGKGALQLLRRQTAAFLLQALLLSVAIALL